MKALSVTPTWAWLIVHGFKGVENRHCQYHHRGRVAILATKEIEPNADQIRAFANQIQETRGGPAIVWPDVMPKGGIIGTTNFVGVVTKSSDPYFNGPVGILCQESKAFQIIPYRGRQGLFEVPDDLIPIEAR